MTTAKKTPAVRMPEDARANGLWHGPDPEELSALTCCECKVINLARIYVSVLEFSQIVAVMFAPPRRKLRFITRGMSLLIRKIQTLRWLPSA